MLHDDVKIMYEDAHKMIETAIKGKTINGTGPSVMLSAIGFLSSYSRNYEKIKCFLNDFCKEVSIDTFDSLYDYSLKIPNAMRMRGGFSHMYSLCNGKIRFIIDGENVDVSTWEWMYCSDIIAITADVFMLELELKSIN